MELSDQEFERALAEIRHRLSSALSELADHRTGDDADRGSGESGEGRVRALAVAGRLESVTFEPVVMRMSAGEVSDAVARAVNTALAGAPAQPPPTPDGVPDLASLLRDLGAVRDEGLHTMELIARTIGEQLAEIGPRTGMRGDPHPYGLEELLHRTVSGLEAYRVDPDSDPGSGPDPGSEARPGPERRPTVDEYLTVLVDVPGQVAAIEIADRAMRLPSQDLAERIVAVVNTALDAAAALPAPRGAAVLGLVGEADEWAQRIQDESFDHLRTYVRALSGIMSSIQDPERR